MGKKSKQGKKKGQAPGDENVINPKEANVGVAGATNGVAKKSKKIKKEKKRLLEAAKLVEAAEHTPDVLETTNVDKKKKKKNKNKQNGNKADVEEKPKELENGNESVPTQVSKKRKKQSNKKKNKENKKPKVVAADKDVVTSESESEEDEEDVFKEMDATNQSILSQPDVNDGSDDEGDQKGVDKKVPEEKKEKRFPGREHSIFIGNLPRTAKQGMMKTLFKPYGRVLTIRFRTFDGVHLLNKKDRKEAKSLNCYIRFETKQEAEAACAMNGQMVEGNRIRVMMQTQKQVGPNTSTVFIGNINRKTTDNDLYDFFSRVGDIEYVRQIADKGIGYVCFKKGVSIAKALKLNQELLNGRPLRILKVDPSMQSTRKNKKGNLVKKNKLPGGVAKLPNNADDQSSNVQTEKAPPQEFHGTVTKNKRDKKKKKKGNSDKKKKVLAQKLMAAGVPKKNQ